HSIHHGRNDRVVPFSKALQMEKILKTKVRKIDGGKHLNAETPRKKLKKLVRRIIADIDRMTLTGGTGSRNKSGKTKQKHTMEDFSAHVQTSE
ncbi:MAG TPA: hypothetical protein VIT68_05100, partial [Candidatus Gracilibacteria bacterium]